MSDFSNGFEPDVMYYNKKFHRKKQCARCGDTGKVPFQPTLLHPGFSMNQKTKAIIREQVAPRVAKYESEIKEIAQILEEKLGWDYCSCEIGQQLKKKEKEKLNVENSAHTGV